jgi:hypothetical protein
MDRSSRRSYPSIGRRDQYAESSVDTPERDRLLAADELRGRARGYVADVKRAGFVVDRHRVRVVRIVRLGYEDEPASGVERRIVEHLEPVRDTRLRDDADPTILPANTLSVRSVAKKVAALRPFEP